MRIHENGAGAPTGRNEAVGRTDDIATTTPPAAGAAQSSDRLTLSPDAEVLRAALGQAAAQPEISCKFVGT